MRDILRSGVAVDRYELVLEVARGGMGAVWLARLCRDHGFQKLFAIKFASVSADDSNGRAMFFDEVRIACGIDHPNVTQVFDVGEHCGRLYAVMEWVEGCSLRQLVAALATRRERFPLGVLLRIMADVCSGLHAAHELCDRDETPLGVVHRDVSPHNILVSHRGATKLIDFGIVKARRRLSEHTSGESLKGKLLFMSPEHAFGDPVDRRADIWSAGAVLFATVTGRPPCWGRSDKDIFEALANYRRPPKMPDLLPRHVAQVVTRALEPRPQDRFATAAQMETAIVESLGEIGWTSTRRVGDFVHATVGDMLEIRRERISMALRRAETSVDAPAEGAEALADLDLEATLVDSADASPLSGVTSLPPIQVRHFPKKLLAAFAALAAAVFVVIPWRLASRGALPPRGTITNASPPASSLDWGMRQAAARDERVEKAMTVSPSGAGDAGFDAR